MNSWNLLIISCNYKIYRHFIKSNFKKNNYYFFENERQREGKEIKRMRGGHECESKRGKNKDKKEKTYIIYIKNSSYLHWVV